MTRQVDAATLKKMIADGDELALLDVREDGQFGEGHMLFAVPMPYSHLEARLGTQLPRRATRTVLVDAGDGVAEHAATRMKGLGYSDVAMLAGGIDAWAAAGYEIFKGVNVPSKAFGEAVEHEAHTPSISADELHAMFTHGEDLVVVDGRTPDGFHRMNIPGGLSVPIAVLEGGREAWTAAGLPLASSPDTPPDAACIDFLFFVHDRHQGNQQAMRDDLSWEEALPAQIAADGDAKFKVQVP